MSVTNCKHLEGCEVIKRRGYKPNCSTCRINEVEKLESMYLKLPLAYAPQPGVMYRITYTYDKEAERHRSIVARGVGNAYYKHQEAICAQWQPGKPPPKGLKLSHHITGAQPTMAVMQRSLKSLRREQED